LGSNDLNATIINDNVDRVNHLLDDLPKAPSAFPDGTVQLIPITMDVRVKKKIFGRWSTLVTITRITRTLLAQLPTFVQKAVIPAGGFATRVVSCDDMFPHPTGREPW